MALAFAVLACAAPAPAFQAGNKARPENPDEEMPVEEPAEEEDDAPLPFIEKMELPTFQRLLQGPPVDWVVMFTRKVIVCEPLAPRPGTLDDINQKIKQATRKAGDPAETDEAKSKRLALYYMPLTLTEGEDREYKLHTRFIKEIIYHEDLMLRRVDKLLDERQVRQAYELLLALEARQDTWPGIAPRRDRLLFTESTVQLEERHTEHALALLEALLERNPAYPNLEAQFGTTADRLLTDSLEARNFREARYFLRRLARKYPNHRAVKDWTARLMQLARDAVEKAVAAERAGQSDKALDSAEEATRLWPDLPDILPVYNRLARRNQRLYAGVVDLPARSQPTAPVILAEAELRRRQMTELPLFEPARLDSKIARYETRFFSDWEPTELGHSLLFRLRPFRTPGDSQPLLTAARLAGALSLRMNPQSAIYDARFAAAVDSLEVPSPFELAVRFRQVPLRPESLFAFACPVAGAADGASYEVASLGPAPQQGQPATYPFLLRSVDDARAVYRRTVPEADSALERHVLDVVEVKYPTFDRAIQGLLRGEVSYLPRVPAANARSLSLRPEFFTLPYGLPTTHVLQFNPHSKALSARTLRRALVYAINRPRILEEVFLGEPSSTLGRVISAPFATTTYAYNRNSGIEPHKFDPALAYSLAKTAEKELAASLPKLRLICSGDPDLLAAAGRLIENWKGIGVEVQLTVAPTATLAADGQESWDILYRTETLAEPLVELWQYLALTTSTETSALGHLPMWLRKQLLELDRAGDGKTAERLLHRLHEQFWAEVHLIPLWEIDDVLVYRKNIRGVPERPLGAYQKIERWRVEPWFTKDQPL
jgi:tetratricopeptide (TPR) repeat protein